MKYALLIYEAEESSEKASPKEKERVMAGYFAFSKEVQEKGVLLGGEALHSVKTASCVEIRGGKTIVTDGPFAETKEQLGGFYLLDCKDLDEAIEYASKIPTVMTGRLEIRPVMTFDEGRFGRRFRFCLNRAAQKSPSSRCSASIMVA